MDDAADLRDARDGDREACARLFARHWALVRGWHRGATRHPHDAEDLTQQTFLRAFERLKQLRDPDRFLPWLRSIARSLIRNRFRRRPEPVLRDLRVVPDPARLAGEAEIRGRVDRAIARLAASDRVLLSLVHVEELPLAQVARFLDLPVTTLRRRLATATGRLARALGREGVRHAM